MRKSEFEQMLNVRLLAARSALLTDEDNPGRFYSGEMFTATAPTKLYLIELLPDYYLLRSDLTFDSQMKRFIHVGHRQYDYTESNLLDTISRVRQMERFIHNMLVRWGLNGAYSREQFLKRFLDLCPQASFDGTHMKIDKTGKVFLSVVEDLLHFVYSEEGGIESFMNLAYKDLNENVLHLCVELLDYDISQAKKLEEREEASKAAMAKALLAATPAGAKR